MFQPKTMKTNFPLSCHFLFLFLFLSILGLFTLFQDTYMCILYISPSPIHSTPQIHYHQNLLTSQLKTMPRKGCKRVGFSSDINERPPVSLRSILDPKPANSRPRSHHRQIPTARSSGSPPVRLFRYVRVNVAKALGLLRKRRPSAKCSSNMVAPQCFVPPRDSLHSETLEDCIEFINSSYRKSI